MSASGSVGNHETEGSLTVEIICVANHHTMICHTEDDLTRPVKVRVPSISRGPRIGSGPITDDEWSPSQSIVHGENVRQLHRFWDILTNLKQALLLIPVFQ